MAGQYKAKGVIIGAVFFIAIFAFSCKKADYVCNTIQTTIIGNDTLISGADADLFGDASCLIYTETDTIYFELGVLMTETRCYKN